MARTREVEQMRSFGLIETQRMGQRIQDAVGGAAEVPTLQAVVIVDAEPRERRDLLAQPRDATRPEHREARVLRSDPRAPGREEVADLALGVHWAQA